MSEYAARKGMAKQNQHDGRGRNHHGQADGHPFHEPDGLLQLAEPDVQGAGDAGGEAEHHTGGGGGVCGARSWAATTITGLPV